MEKTKDLRSYFEFGEASECRRGLLCGMGITPEEQNVEGDPAYFTPHGGITSMREYEAETNTLEIVLGL